MRGTRYPALPSMKSANSEVDRLRHRLLPASVAALEGHCYDRQTRSSAQARQKENTNGHGRDKGPIDPTDPLFLSGDAAAHEDLPDKSADYEVGYGKPPKHSQFKPGVSPYPQGRKKGARGRKDTFEKIAKEFVKIREDGRVRNMPREEALQRQLFAKAFTDLKAVPHLLNYMRGDRRERR